MDKNEDLPSCLNIAMVVGSFSTKGGLELYTYQLVNELLNRGHRLTVICREDSGDLSHPNLKVVKFEAASGGSKAQKLKLAYEKASMAVEDNGPFDIVHSQHLPISNADVVTFHNHSAVHLQKVGLAWERTLNKLKLAVVPAYTLRYRLDDLLCRRARCLIFPAAVMKEDFYCVHGKNGQLDHTPYVVAHPGSTLSRQGSCVNQTGENGQPFVFLFVGRGYRKKGLDILLAACEILSGQKRNFKLLIAGLRQKPIDALRLSVMGLSKHVQYLGFCNNMDEIFARCRVLTMPSRMEPFGMAPLQAMRWGVVPIVSRVSGVAEVLEPGVNSLILENHLNPAELARLMARLMDDKELLGHLSGQALQRAQVVSWSQTADATEHAYRLALSCPEKPPGCLDKTQGQIQHS